MDMDPQIVLRCGRCNKPFDKQSTLKRHGYYCRSRKDGENIQPRSRSCTSCVKRKARCDSRRPSCSRCLAKTIKCDYPSNTVTSKDTRTGQPTPPSEASNQESLLANYPGDPSLHGWGMDFDFADFLNLPANEESDLALFSPPATISSSSVRQSTPSVHQTALQTQQTVSSPSPSIPTQLIFSPRYLIWRPEMDLGMQKTANLILHTLKSYPSMMIRHNTLPPFVHPSLTSLDVENDDIEPLNNCISLLHMLNSGVRGSRKLFWKNVRMECERLSEKRLRLNRWELLAATQALAIYLIIRLDEGQTDDNNFDSLLIAAVITIATQLGHLGVTRIDDFPTAWEAWVWEESARRICVIYQVLDMIVYFEPANMCHLHKAGLVMAPLPAKKQLWEASSKVAWEAENEKDSDAQTAFALAANGQLVKLADPDHARCGEMLRVHTSSIDPSTAVRSAAGWEEWCSGMDGLGGLVMLAASLTA